MEQNFSRIVQTIFVTVGLAAFGDILADLNYLKLSLKL